MAIEHIGQPAKLLRREIAPATLDVSNLSCSYAKPCCDLHLRETPRRANVGNAPAEPAVVAQPCRATACRPAVAGAQILAKHDRYSSLVASLSILVLVRSHKIVDGTVPYLGQAFQLARSRFASAMLDVGDLAWADAKPAAELLLRQTK